MDIYVIGDEETVLGFRLIDINGFIPEDDEDARNKLDSIIAENQVSLLFITRNFANEMREKINNLKMQSMKPLVVEIPGSQMQPAGESIEDLVRRAIGISI